MAPKTADTKLPPDLGQRLRTLLELETAPATLRALIAGLAARSFVPSQDQLCATAASRHSLRTATRAVPMNCVMDALLLPLLNSQEADITSASPRSGSLVTARITPEAIEFEPPGAVISFGAARDPTLSGNDALCPYINAFPSAAEYQAWAAATPAAITVMLPLTQAYTLARDYLVEAARGDAGSGGDRPVQGSGPRGGSR